MKILFGWLLFVAVLDILGNPFFIGKERKPRTGADYVVQLFICDIPLLLIGLWYFGVI